MFAVIQVYFTIVKFSLYKEMKSNDSNETSEQPQKKNYV